MSRSSFYAAGGIHGTDVNFILPVHTCSVTN